MFLATDTRYLADRTATAGILFDDWTASVGLREVVHTSASAAAYVPGRFYLRELPAILDLVNKLDETLEVLVIDAYVWLDQRGTPGLGAHLFEAMGKSAAVIGVAKTAYAGSVHAHPVLRGDSRRPLFVTAAGVDPAQAATWVAAMHGAHRIPTLLKRADQLCRAALAP